MNAEAIRRLRKMADDLDPVEPSTTRATHQDLCREIRELKVVLRELILVEIETVGHVTKEPVLSANPWRMFGL